ncbi:MAG: ferrous iron transport protein B [bacterium]
MNDVQSMPGVFAVAGNPNSGKTTLFNRLTGLRQKVGNYPGVTVEKKTGFVRSGDHFLELVDLPGTYSLSPRSEEERVAAEVVSGSRPDLPPLRAVLCVVDATNLERSLYLTLQVLEAKVPVVVVLNMMDELAARGGQVNVNKLSKLLGVPVFPISALKGDGLDDLKAHLEKLSRGIDGKTLYPLTERKPEKAGVLCGGCHGCGTSQCASVPVDSPDILADVNVPEAARRQARAGRIHRQVSEAPVKAHPLTNRIDRVVLHPVWGPLIFVLVVLLVFQSIFTWAQPAMDGMDQGVAWLGSLLANALPVGMFRSFLVDGVVEGVGAVLVFLPQILILFFFIAVLEHTGYMARAAMVMDRLMSSIGLQGKSFLPLISSYACAVPGIMATRTIENRRDRIATLFIAPFMTCSARLPVYILLIGAFVPDLPVVGKWIGLRTLTLLGLYVLGFLGALGTAALLKSTILRSGRVPFVMEVPPYRVPSVKTILILMWDRSLIFLKRAGTTILAVSVLMWFLVSFPRPDAQQDIRQSYAGRLGVMVEPVVKPLGFDWRIGVGLLSAQAAREVIISTLSTVYHVAKDKGTEGPEATASLTTTLQKDMTPLTAISLMVYFVFAMQCASTLAVVKRETGRWRWPFAMFTYMTALAYVSSLCVFQFGRWAGWG